MLQAMRAVSGIKWTTFSMLFTTALMMMQVVILGRFLQPSEYGVLALIMIIIGFSEIFVNFGLSEAIVQNEANTTEQLSSLFFANVIFSILVFSIGSILIWQLFPYQEYKVLCVVAISSVVINSFSLQFKALLQRSFFFSLLAIIEIISYLAGFLMLLIALYFGYGIWSVVIGFITRITLSVSCHIINAVKQSWLPSFYFRMSVITDQLKFGLNLLGANLLNYLSSRFDQVVIGAVLGPTALGYYAMAFNLVIQPMQKLNPVVTKVAFPILARLQKSRADLTKGYINLLLAVVLLNTPIMLSIYYLAPYFIGPLLGDNWLLVIPLIQILCFYALLRATGNAGATLVLATGKTSLLFKWNFIVTGLQPLIILLAAKLGDVNIVAYALVLLQLVLLFAWYRMVVVSAIGPCFKKYALSIFMPLTSFSLTLFVIDSLYSLFTVANMVNKSIVLAICCVLYSVSVFLGVKQGYLFKTEKVV